MEYPVFKFKVKEDGTQTGMLGISLVDTPAIDSLFVTFEAEVEKPQYIALKDESGKYKQELLGAALRPDLPILRKDEAGNFYYGVFDAETIEVIRNKFHKQKNTSEVNLQHNPDAKIDAYLIESYLLSTQAQLEATKALGLEDIELGAWIVRYKVESEELFNQIINGEVDVKGFSVEIMLERELVEAQKNNFKQTNTIMSKFNQLIDRFKSVLAEFEDETPAPATETTLEDVTVAETGMILRYTEIGAPVMEVTVDEAGVETEVQAAEGEFILEDGRTVVVDADGNLVEIKDSEEEVAPVDEEMETETPAEENAEELAEEEVPAEETPTEVSDLDKKLSELIPTDADGSYQLEVYVSDGKISFGTLYSYTYKDLKLSDLVEKFELLKADNVKLQEENKKPIGKPVFTEFKGEKINGEKKEFKNNLDFQLHRLGIVKD